MSKAYVKWTLIGGTSGSLDSVDGALLSTDDIAFGSSAGANNFYFYRYMPSTAAESAPSIIKPDQNPGSYRWIKQGITASVGSTASFDVITSSSATFGKLSVTSSGTVKKLNVTSNLVAPIITGTSASFKKVAASSHVSGSSGTFTAGLSAKNVTASSALAGSSGTFGKLNVTSSGTIKKLSVSSGFTAPNNVMDNSTNNAFTKAQRYTISALTCATGGNSDINFSSDNYASVTLTTDLTLNAPTGLKADRSVLLVVTQSSATARTLSFNAVYDFAGTTAAVSTALSAQTNYMFWCSSSTGKVYAKKIWEDN